MGPPCASAAEIQLQGLHSVAYHGGLARPLIAPPGAASRLTGDDLAQFVSEHFTGASMALAGTLVASEMLCWSWTEACWWF